MAVAAEGLVATIAAAAAAAADDDDDKTGGGDDDEARAREVCVPVARHAASTPAGASPAICRSQGVAARELQNLCSCTRADAAR